MKNKFYVKVPSSTENHQREFEYFIKHDLGMEFMHKHPDNREETIGVFMKHLMCVAECSIHTFDKTEHKELDWKFDRKELVFRLKKLHGDKLCINPKMKLFIDDEQGYKLHDAFGLIQSYIKNGKDSKDMRFMYDRVNLIRKTLSDGYYLYKESTILNSIVKRFNLKDSYIHIYDVKDISMSGIPNHTSSNINEKYRREYLQISKDIESSYSVDMKTLWQDEMDKEIIKRTAMMMDNDIMEGLLTDSLKK